MGRNLFAGNGWPLCAELMFQEFCFQTKLASDRFEDRAG